MKIKCLFTAALMLAAVSINFSQSKTTTGAVTPEMVVKNLYAAQKSGKNAPFFQSKNRAAVDKYFAKDLADMIWKDAVDAKGEVGAIDFDPLYNSQDPQITDFVINKPREAGGPDNAFVLVTFKNYGKADKVDYELARDAKGMWKIVTVSYGDGEDLGSILRYYQDAEFKADYDKQDFKGDYLVGTKKCTVTPTLNGIYFRVQCEDSEDFQLYQAEGDENETAYIYTNDKGVEQGKFVFKNGESSGYFTDASGKKMAVGKVETEPVTEPESMTVSGTLETGKTNSVILYVGEESGDYAAYCFKNDSEAGKAILAACKNGEQCEVVGMTDEDEGCEVPGLEADLSARAKITKVESVKKNRQKKVTVTL